MYNVPSKEVDNDIATFSCFLILRKLTWCVAGRFDIFLTTLALLQHL